MSSITGGYGLSAWGTSWKDSVGCSPTLCIFLQSRGPGRGRTHSQKLRGGFDGFDGRHSDFPHFSTIFHATYCTWRIIPLILTCAHQSANQYLIRVTSDLWDKPRKWGLGITLGSPGFSSFQQGAIGGRLRLSAGSVLLFRHDLLDYRPLGPLKHC